MTRKSVAIIGAGRVGQAVGLLLHRAGFSIAGVVARNAARAAAAAELIGAGRPTTDPRAAAAQGQLVFLTVPDDALAGLARQLAAAGVLNPDQVLIHTSGALPAAALRPPDQAAGSVGPRLLSLHPIQSIAEARQGAQLLAGAYWGVEGDAEVLGLGQQLIRAMGGKPLLIKPGQKALYHAAACTVSNYMVSLAAAGVQMMAAAGVDPQEALPALTSLMAGTLANLRAVGLPAALTGPIERGDAQTVQDHWTALTAADAPPTVAETAPLYRIMGQYTAALALTKHGAPGEGKEPPPGIAAIATFLEGRSVDD